MKLMSSANLFYNEVGEVGPSGKLVTFYHISRLPISEERKVYGDLICRDYSKQAVQIGFNFGPLSAHQP